MGIRKPAPRLAVPAQRYFKGKAPVKGADPLASDSDAEETVEPQNGEDEAIEAFGEQDEVTSKPSNVNRQPVKAERSVKVELRDVKVSAEGKIIGAAPVVSGSSLGVQGWLWSFSYTLDMLTLEIKWRRRPRAKKKKTKSHQRYHPIPSSHRYIHLRTSLAKRNQDRRTNYPNLPSSDQFLFQSKHVSVITRAPAYSRPLLPKGVAGRL